MHDVFTYGNIISNRVQLTDGFMGGRRVAKFIELSRDVCCHIGQGYTNNSD